MKGKRNAKRINFRTFFEFSTPEIKTIWRMQYLFLILANTIVCKYNKFNLGTVNATQ